MTHSGFRMPDLALDADSAWFVISRMTFHHADSEIDRASSNSGIRSSASRKYSTRFGRSVASSMASGHLMIRYSGRFSKSSSVRVDRKTPAAAAFCHLPSNLMGVADVSGSSGSYVSPLGKRKRCSCPASGGSCVQFGAVTLIQRFGSALNLNIHLHRLFLDGVYVGEAASSARFSWVKAPTSAELTPSRTAWPDIWSARDCWCGTPSTVIRCCNLGSE